MRRVWFWICLIVVSLPAYWTATKSLQLIARKMVREDILASIRSEEIYTRFFSLSELISFGNYHIFGRGLVYSNIGETLERNELKQAIDRMAYVPFPANRPYDVYLRLEKTQGGQPTTSWYHGVLKVCGDRPCPYDQQTFERTEPLPPESTDFGQIDATKQLRVLGFRFRVSCSVTVNGRREIFGVSCNIADRAQNPIDRILRTIAQAGPPDYLMNVVQIGASYPGRVCRVQTQYSIFDGECFRLP